VVDGESQWVVLLLVVERVVVDRPLGVVACPAGCVACFAFGFECCCLACPWSASCWHGVPRYAAVMVVLIVLVVLGVVVFLVVRWVLTADLPQDDPGVAVQTTRANSKPTIAPVIEDVDVPEGAIDLRGVPSWRLRVVGAANYLSERARTGIRVTTWLLRREPDNPHDVNAVAVLFVDGRQAGYVSAAQAQYLAPLLDQLGAVFVVTGVGSAGTSSIRLWVDIPKAPELRAFVKQQS
jgi:hypothetical protein